jgi:hypothetical protein
MALVSHEVPLDLLEASRKFNDYHYCLPHLLNNEVYYKFFKDASARGETIICDNGLFEGVSHTINDLLEKINDIKPSIFITPDVWNDPHNTIINAKKWIDYYANKIPSTTNLMAVVQAKTVSDAMLTYSKYIELGFTHIALNHAGIYFKELYKHQNELLSLMNGRIRFVNMLPSLKGFSGNIHHHLLGATLPNEFSNYKGKEYSFIKTIDTSNPVIYGLKHGKYPDEVLLDKPKEKLETYFDQKLSDQQISDVLYNVKHFRTLLS